MNIAVYLGSNAGHDPAYREAVRELGHWIGDQGHRLVYGGSRTGLMGELALAVLARGGEVIGVEPGFFMDREFQLEGLTELIVTETMQERRAIMMEKADFFIAFPGGAGTAEEISEVICAGSLGHLQKIYGYYNVNGFYEFARDGYDRMVKEGFLNPENRGKIHFWNSLEEIAESVTEADSLNRNRSCFA